MKKLIKGGIIVNEGRSFRGDLVIDGEIISKVIKGEAPRGNYDEVVDASGCFVLPGVIDDHVHFREPGLTRKGDIESESKAAAYGGVTSYLEMPNTIPQTTTLEALRDKRQLGAEKSHVNYSFFYGATNDNVDTFGQLDIHHVPGIKLFMGSSTGNMLVDKREALERVFQTAKQLGLPVMAHCEDTQIINRRMEAAKVLYGDDPDVKYHPVIRSREACLASSQLAVELARKYGTQLHIAHISTEEELELLGEDENITGEAVVAHLLFGGEEDYELYGTRIKCNPAIKELDDNEALVEALTNGKIYTIGTDHAPHELKDKEGGCCKAASGMPMIQFSLPAMLDQAAFQGISICRIVELMCHNPARLFKIDRRGFLRKGYQADIAIVRESGFHYEDENLDGAFRDVVRDCDVVSKCGWTPLNGCAVRYRVEHTFCNGHHIYNKGKFLDDYRGEELVFRK